MAVSAVNTTPTRTEFRNCAVRRLRFRGEFERATLGKSIIAEKT
jgi:hypothetical protein